jgi:DNA anti-recombination protein RmuC
LRARLDELADQVSSTDERVTSVSTELANQLTELSRDIDELNRREQDARADALGASEDGPAEVDTAEIEARLNQRLDETLDDVLTTTERLAAEQARYEIKFRADLAELAERIRRPGPA